jgi:hypothetical protein
MKLKALLVVGLLLMGCATTHVNHEYKQYSINDKTITIGMSNAEVKDAFGVPSSVQPIGSAINPQLVWRYIVDGEANSNTDRVGRGLYPGNGDSLKDNWSS